MTSLRAPLLKLLLVQMSELVDLWRLASNDTLCEFGESADSGAAANRILRCLGRDLDDADSGILWATIVSAITEVANPGLECWAVVLADLLAIGLNGCLTGDGGPFTGGGKEGDVDLGIGFEVVGLSGLGVGVEDEVYSVALLGGKSHAARHEKSTLGYPCGHHAELLLLDEGDEILNLVLQIGIWLKVLLNIWVGRLAAGICVAERHLALVTGEVSCKGPWGGCL